VIRAVHLYPSTMDTYGDRGNVAGLTRRATLRGIELHWQPVEIGQAPPDRCDLVFMGGGQDRVQHTVAADLQRLRAWFERVAGDGGAVFAVCAGLQLLGRRYVAADGSELSGVGLLDLETVAAAAGEWRLIGNVVAEVDTPSGPRLLAGFENHGGRTWLGDVVPLGHVRIGGGNNGRDGGEGVRSGTVLATYLHGPVLPKNAWLTDHLLELATRHAGGPSTLPPLDHRREDAAQAEAIAAAERDEHARHGWRATVRRFLGTGET
jgi:lipid II isoglutaminyl synthase (glutamine-hydrolysing)